MDVNPSLPTNALPTAQSAAVAQLFRLVAGDISQLPAGQTLPATVVKVAAGETVLALAGQQVTIKGTVPATPGEVVTVRVQPGAKPTVAVIGSEQPPTTGSAKTTTGNAPPTPSGLTLQSAHGPSTTPTSPRGGEVGSGATATDLGEGPTAKSNAPPGGVASSNTAPVPQRASVGVGAYRQTAAPAPAEPVVVDVIAREPSGQLRVRIDGREATATSPQQMQPGGRYVVRVDRTPAGIVLRPLPDSPQLPATIATAILRTDKPPPLGDSLPSLVKELTRAAAGEPSPAPLANSPATPAAGSVKATLPTLLVADQVPAPTPPADPKVRAAAAEVRDVAVKLLPSPDEPPTAEKIKQLVEDGGTHFEAKLARAADTSRPDRPDPPTPRTDLKSGLLSLARTVADLSAAFPAAAATLDGIERQQAVNVLSQQNGGMAVFQIPFPDGPHWRTLGLGIEPDRNSQPDSSGKPTGFRVMMHVPLTTLGETWIDASAESNRLRAVLYVSDASARERVRGELPELRSELQAGGFGEVLLDVRPALDLTDAQRRKANAIREGVPESGGLLNVTA